ncbi:WD40 repeat-like protein [Serendipita vermifera]|nr:WD40 repeat-like protein [Serendipita vermifera]
MLPLQQQMQLGNAQQQIPPPPPQQQIPNLNELSLAGVLHFLQTEWRRYERERNEWEIERAEMRARIALLEGERRSFENIKIDLLRRVKMMEYALRVERSKQLQQAGGSAPSGKPPSVKDEPQNETVPPPKEGSGENSPHSEDAALPAEARLSIGSLPNGGPGVSKTSQPAPKESWSAGANAANLSLGKPPLGRDPRSRARSRDYLKQCLLEVSYLTSPQAMNPLSNRPLINAPGGNVGSGGPMQGNGNSGGNSMQGGLAIPNLPNFGSDGGLNGRPKKGLLDINNKDFPLVNGGQSGDRNEKMPLFGGATGLPAATSVSGSLVPPTNEPRSGDAIAQIITNPMAREGGQEEEPTQLTAIFRPDDNSQWQEKLRQAKEEAAMRQNNMGGGYMSNMSTGTSMGAGQGIAGSGWDLGFGTDEPVIGAGVEDEEEDGSLMGDDSGKKWKVRKTLRNHLDAVRAVSFHPKEMILASGGDDFTVKIWRMDAAQLASTSAGRTAELEPQVTLRGHSAAVTSLAIAPHRGLVYSASLDSTIRVWSIPSSQHTTYSPYDPSTTRGELVGHTDAVWGLTLLREGSLLVSCGADGMVKVWDVGGIGPGSLRSSWGYNGIGAETGSGTEEKDIIGATAVESIMTNLKWVAVAYRNGIVKIFDAEIGKEVAALQADETVYIDGTPATQVNAMVSHPALPLLVVGYEDKNIRVFDLSTFTCTHSMLTHLDAVTALSLDPSGHTLVSGSHDNSVRFWDLLGQKQCIQEDTKHRQKGEEGVLAVQFHPSLPFMASAGADGLVKIWASS